MNKQLLTRFEALAKMWNCEIVKNYDKLPFIVIDTFDLKADNSIPSLNVRIERTATIGVSTYYSVNVQLPFELDEEIKVILITRLWVYRIFKLYNLDKGSREMNKLIKGLSPYKVMDFKLHALSNNLNIHVYTHRISSILTILDFIIASSKTCTHS